ncbi:hypothetical protein LCGC14_1691850, partial [marine sediment metagenome]
MDVIVFIVFIVWLIFGAYIASRDKKMDQTRPATSEEK